MLGRGLDVILRASGMGFEVTDLSCAPKGLLRDVQLLLTGDNSNLCERCGLPKTSLNGVVCDAGQFFEMVTPNDAVAAAQAVMQEVQRTTMKSTVTVLKTKKVHGFLGGSPNLFGLRSVVFSFADLLDCFWASTLVSFCYLGNLVFRLSGLPIGGLLSKVASGFVLAFD